MSATELKFDKMEYDTSIAKDFLNQHPKFVGFNCENEVNRKVTNSIGKEIRLGNASTEKTKDIIIEDVEVKKKKLWKLSQMIVENIELFCQLEYMIRKIKPDEIRAYDLTVITQNLLYCSSEKYQPPNPGPGVPGNVYMKNGSSLVRLACFAQKILETNGRIDIVSEKDAAIVCWLFAHLCGRAGFENQVSLNFVEDIPNYEPEYLLDVYECNDDGCIAVVTGKADIDSAIDVIAEAPPRVPWGVRRVLVQENVLERFRTALEGKARVCPGEVDDTLSQRSTSAFAIGDKIFLIEYAGEALENKGIVVEAYRTVKELLSLLSKFQPYALSVWCDSVSESNEIAHNVSSNIVWVNTYGEFDGPPQACLLSKIPKTEKIHVSNSFIQVRSAWEKLSISERVAKLRDLLDKHNITADINDSFYYVSRSFTCAGTEKVAGTLVLRAFEKYTIPQLLMYVLKGGSIVFCTGSGLSIPLNSLYVALKDAGAPVEVISESGCDINEMKTGNCMAHGDITYNQKFIWTSYGTTFAN